MTGLLLFAENNEPSRQKGRPTQDVLKGPRTWNKVKKTTLNFPIDVVKKIFQFDIKLDEKLGTSRPQ